MAVETQTQGTTGDGRALNAALSAPAPFTGRAASLALHASDRHVDRWAAETEATSRSRSLGTLSFVDRPIGPWLSGVAAPARPGAAEASNEGRLPSVSWVFPRPWYQDELDWMAAAREGGDQSRSGLLTTRGTYAAPAAAPAPQVQRVMAPGVIAATARTGGQTTVAVSDQPMTRRTLQSELAYVAPSFATGATFVPETSGVAPMAPSYAGISSSAGLPSVSATAEAPGVRAMAPAAAIAAMAQQRALRVWSPQVSFAATQAAEVMAGVIGGVERAAIATQGTAAAAHSPMLEGLAYVAPAEMETYAPARGATAAPTSAIAPSSTAPIARAIAQLAAAQAVASAAPASRTDRVASAEAARIAVSETAAPVHASAAPSAQPTPAVIAYRAEQARVLASMETQQPTSSLPAFEQLVQLASSSPAASHAMRGVELMARSAITGTVAPVSGPRVALPAGLGGAVIGHDAAVTAHRPMVTMSPAETAAPALLDERGLPIAPAARAVPTFQPVWTAPFAQQMHFAPQMHTVAGAPAAAPRLAASQTMTTPALTAIAGERPAAVDHLAWTDRWLARFAGASPTSLAAVDVASERSVAVPRAFAAGAPEVVFVIPGLDEPAAAAPAARPSLAVAPPARGATPPTQALRIGDDESTPDEVFAAISRTSRPRMPAPAPTSRIATTAPAMPTLVPAAPATRPTMADQIARSAPSAPDAGLYAGLASSPMAPALAGVLPLPAAPVFDPRALYAGGVLSAYLGGAITRAATPGTAIGTPAMTMWPTMAGSPWIDASPSIAAQVDAPTLGIAARAPETTFVRPDAGDGETPVARRVDAPTSVPTATPAATPALVAPRAETPAPAGAALPISTWAAAAAALDPTIWSLRAESSMVPAAAPTTMSGIGASGAALDAPLGDVDAAGWSARPGMTAELAHGFAVHTERAAADLSFDFVSPEQVLAARVYGFGPIEAAQAARLAVSGPAGIAAMASAIDLTFLRQMHIEAERAAAPSAGDAAAAPRTRREAPVMIPPVLADGGVEPSEVRAAEVRTAEVRAAEVRAAEVRASAPAPAAPAAGAAPVFGVGRRLPRGAFMWPAGSVAALDLRADLPEGAAAMQVAALELLAASAVAEMGALVSPASGDDFGDAPAAAPGVRGTRALPSSFAAPSMPTVAPDAATAAGEPAVEQVAEALAVPSAQRARFESIYLSMSRSPGGTSMSPSVRAARALAIATHQSQTSEAGPTSAQERAFAAWSVMPMVYAGSAEPATSASTWTPAFAAAARERQQMDVYAPSTDDEITRPGMSGLAARAGEAIGSYVQPTASEVTRASSGAVATTAAQQAQQRATGEPFVHELIRQGRGFTRVGGGEVEIPSWFESAAKKMLEQRGLGENLSLAELTLVASAPSAQVAASTKTASPVQPATASPGTGEKAETPDIEKIANDVYTEILRMLDVSRERSGDPWQ